MTAVGDDLIHLPRPIGFVLGGGGSLGAVQVGMIRALLEHGVTPDLVVGTSVGAFNGAVLAADPTNAVAKLDDFWRSSKRKDAFPLRGIKPLLHWRRTKHALYPNHGLRRCIDGVLGDWTLIEDLRLPFGAVAIEVTQGRPVLFREGDLPSALLASAAIPGLFPPVERGGEIYYDGGLGSNVPMREAVGMGAQSLVVLDTTHPSVSLDTPHGLMELFSYVTEVYSRQLILRDLHELSHVPTLYPPSPAPGTMSPLDLKHTEELLEASYRDTLHHLKRKVAVS